MGGCRKVVRGTHFKSNILQNGRMPEWSNGADSRSVGLVPTRVRILLRPCCEGVRTLDSRRWQTSEEAIILCKSVFRRIRILSIALVTQPGLECFPPKEEVAGSNPAESVGFEPIRFKWRFEEANSLFSGSQRILPRALDLK